MYASCIYRVGIGLAIVRKFVESEATVYVIDKCPSDLEEVKKTYPTVTTVIIPDLTAWNSTRKILKALGPMHHLVNNTGLSRPAELFMDIKPNSIDE